MIKDWIKWLFSFLQLFYLDCIYFKVRKVSKQAVGFVCFYSRLLYSYMNLLNDFMYLIMPTQRLMAKYLVVTHHWLAVPVEMVDLATFKGHFLLAHSFLKFS